MNLRAKLLPAIALGAGLCAAFPSNAGIWHYNQDLKNTTGQSVNDLHMELVSNGAISLTDTYQCIWCLGNGPAASAPFGLPNISGSGSGQVNIDWSGATVNNGEWTHVGWEGTATNPITIFGAYWTRNGIPVLPKITGVSTPWNVSGEGIFGGAAAWITIRVSILDNLDNVIATQWWETQSDATLGLTNMTGDTIRATVAVLNSPTEIALANLNGQLTGFGRESPIQTIDPEGFFAAPAPATLWLVASALSGLGVFRRRSRILGSQAAPSPKLL
jgi:hypothetical protein